MEKLQVIFVITLWLQITQTFIVVIRIELLQPEKEKEKNKATNV